MVNPRLHPRPRHRPFRREDTRPLLRLTYDRQREEHLAYTGDGQPASSRYATLHCCVDRNGTRLASPHWLQLKTLFADAERNSALPSGLKCWSEDPEPPFRSISGACRDPLPAGLRCSSTRAFQLSRVAKLFQLPRHAAPVTRVAATFRLDAASWTSEIARTKLSISGSINRGYLPNMPYGNSGPGPGDIAKGAEHRANQAFQCCSGKRKLLDENQPRGELP